MADLCLIYLTLPDFALENSEDVIRQSVLEGTHAFLDYAISYWGWHIETGLLRIGTSEGDRNLEIEPLLNNLETFLDHYWNVDESLEAVSVCDTLRKTLGPLKGMEMYDEALQCISAMKHALRLNGKNSSLDDMLSIYGVLQKSREVLESMWPPPSDVAAFMKDRYGITWFKCSRLNCRYFYQGFEMDVLRQRHRDRHDRSYVCWIEGCFQAINGCATAKDLEKHMAENHGILKEDEKDEFPPPEKSGGVPEDQRGQHLCTKCPKRYKTPQGLNNHILTKCTERQKHCTKCGKGFKRGQERKRHEDSHDGEKRFICSGLLLYGGTWGCGKQFMRKDALNKHWRTTGRNCRKSQLLEDRE